MPQQLIEILGELGLTQYRDAFVEQGFDTWDTILDITESDMYVRSSRVAVGIETGINVEDEKSKREDVDVIADC